jgi:glucoamylase
MSLLRKVQEQHKQIFTIALIVLAAIPLIILLPRYLQGPRTLPLASGEAPDGNWTTSTWAPANNTLLGTSASTASDVWFTGHDGVVSGVFYPTADTPNSTVLEFLIGNSAHTWVDEEQYDTTAQTRLYNNHALAWITINTARSGLYQIKKIVYTDPTHDSLIQQVTFTALKGTLADYLLYVYYHPAMQDAGNTDDSYTEVYNNMSMLVSTDATSDYASALAASIPYQQNMISSGFVRFNDGLTDLKGLTNCGSDKCPDYTMNYGYNKALRGNIAQMGLLDLSNGGKNNLTSSTSITFKLVLSFGQTEEGVSGMTNAEATLYDTLSDRSNLLGIYISQWNTFDNRLNLPPAVGPTQAVQQACQQEYYLAANVLKASQDKQTGAFVAGLGNPWGMSQGDQDTDGYHMVFMRDLYQISDALIVAGDTADPLRALAWVFNNQQEQDGHFPMSTDLSGTVHSSSILMEDQAFPLMLAWKLHLTDNKDYIQHIKPAADYIVAHGPTTPYDQWGENSGYAPETIAAEISGLICAADIAAINKDTASQKKYLDTADAYQKNIVKWTYTTNGPLGNSDYFLRISAQGDPNSNTQITLANGGGTYDERDIVSPGFLELVRQGIFPADSPYITSSLAAIDTTISQTINGNRYWFRYDHDGYGEHQDDTDYDGSGVGRLWPLLSGERGIYTVAANGNADSYITAMLASANSSGMIPEQIWDLNAPNGEKPGTPTRSIAPFNWAMGEYITLLMSVGQHKIADMIPLVDERYVVRSQNRRWQF